MVQQLTLIYFVTTAINSLYKADFVCHDAMLWDKRVMVLSANIALKKYEFICARMNWSGCFCVNLCMVRVEWSWWSLIVFWVLIEEGVWDWGWTIRFTWYNHHKLKYLTRTALHLMLSSSFPTNLPSDHSVHVLNVLILIKKQRYNALSIAAWAITS